MPAAPAYGLASLPSTRQTLLLRAVLLSEDRARDAWEAWRAQEGDPREALRGESRLWVKKLLPLLFWSMSRNDLSANQGLRTFLKLAYTGERARHAFCRHIVRKIIKALDSAAVAHLVIQGFASAETLYPEPCLRHCHDLDLLPAHADGIRARKVIADIDFASDADTEFGGARFVHASGFPVVLHSRLLSAEMDAAPLHHVLQRAVRRPVAGVSATVLAPADALLQACVAACSGRSRASPMWVCDSWFLLQRLRGERETLMDTARSLGIEQSLSRILHYLATELDAPSSRV